MMTQRYALTPNEMDLLEQVQAVEGPVEFAGGELIYLNGIIKFTRHENEDWLGPEYPNDLVDGLLDFVGIKEPTLVDFIDPEEDSDDDYDSNLHRAEEPAELRAEQFVARRLMKPEE